MPRYYRRRYTRVVKPKKKWATNMANISSSGSIYSNQVAFVQKICQNVSQDGNPTPVILKTGNFKLQLDATFTPETGAAVSFSTYIMYVPEGMWPSQTANYVNDISTLISRHPEWILAWKYSSNDFISSTGPGNVDSVRVSSRLKRNLNSGDAIYFIGIGVTSAGNTFTSTACRGLCQFWTCAN